MTKGWAFVVSNTSAAILTSAIIAAIVASLGVRTQRAIARTRETFNAINLDNIDKDVIEARTRFMAIRARVDFSSDQHIGKYADLSLAGEEDRKDVQVRSFDPQQVREFGAWHQGEYPRREVSFQVVAWRVDRRLERPDLWSRPIGSLGKTPSCTSNLRGSTPPGRGTALTGPTVACAARIAAFVSSENRSGGA